MPHFAKLDAGNVVLSVEVIDASVAKTEAQGVKFLRSLYGPETRWVQTDERGGARKNFAGLGYTYDEGRDAFIPPRPPGGYTLDETTCRWEPVSPG